MQEVIPSMSASGEPRPLIVGIGNPLRGDDGLGSVVVQYLTEEMGEACDIVAVHQLTPELAPSIAAASLVILIDASVKGQPGDVQVRQVLSSTESDVLDTHHYAPDALVALTVALFGICPPLFIVSATGALFDLGEQLSSIVAQQVPAVIAAVRQICALSAFAS
jgi:hydrogenase maturation protease